MLRSINAENSFTFTYMQSLSTYINNPDSIDASVVDELYQLVERYPSFQAARLLLLRGLYQLQDGRFGAELSRTAICMPSRERLFELFETELLQEALVADRKGAVARALTPAQPGSETSGGTDRTLTLIDTFLGQQPQPAPTRRPRPAEAAVDYTAYLLQLDDAVAVPESAAEAEHNDAAANQQNASEQPSVNLEESEQEHLDTLSDVEEPADEPADESTVNDNSDTYFTETLARIYIKQGKYAKAIEIIRRISLLYPQKNRYFADQIRFLEKLLLNESHKITQESQQ